MASPDVNIAHIVINEHGKIFAELIEILIDPFRTLGLRTMVSKNQLVTDRLNVIVGATAFLSRDEYLTLCPGGVEYVVFQVEALHDQVGFAPEVPAYIAFLSSARQVWDYSPANIPILARWGCGDVRHIPIGHCRAHERIDPEIANDIDVLFYGAMSPRRVRVLEALAARGVRVHSRFGLYGAARDQAIARAKIVLNIHQFETGHLEVLRLSYLLNNRRFVISEAANRDPYDGGVVYCDYAQLVDCCMSYLRLEADSERDRIAARGYEALTRISTTQSVQAAMANRSMGRGTLGTGNQSDRAASASAEVARHQASQ